MQALIAKRKQELIAIYQSLNIKRLYAFGSAVSGDFRDDSDMDFLISFSDNLTVEEYTNNYFTLHYKLRELFNREIDIVTEKTLSNPYFIESINESKLLIYEAWSKEIPFWHKTSIESIHDFLGEKRNFFEYQNNKLLRRGIEREIEIIGEAMNRIMKIAPEIQIENARQIVDARNWVIHGYDKVDDVVIWGIISIHLPKLKKEVENYLAKE